MGRDRAARRHERRLNRGGTGAPVTVFGRGVAAAALASVCLVPPVAAQTGDGLRASGTLVAEVSRLDPVPSGGAATEARVEQPVVTVLGGVPGGHLRAAITLNLEGLTIPNGVLSPGAFGEGYFDRRHPHTYVHEAILSGIAGRSSVQASLTLGKGFVAFGSDDPMNRPGLRFPVNHHFSQILERAVVIGGLRAGPVTVEGSLFNGDEPERPGQLPKLDRVGDSWAVRLTLHPLGWFEGQGSFAHVKSPEHRPGAGPTQRKWSASLRAEAAIGGGAGYGLAEWARTTDADGFFVYRSGLVEVEYRRARHRPYYRFERSERPEEERQLDPFRSVRPHLDDSILGITRWTIHTLGYGLGLRASANGPVVEPFAELAYAHVSDVGAGLFRAEVVYGGDTLWSLTIGVRLTAGVRHRMGRYGVQATRD